MISRIVYLFTVWTIKVISIVCNALGIIFHIRLINNDSLPTNRPLIIAATHESCLDIVSLVVLLISIFKKIRFIAKKGLWELNKLFSWWLDMVYTIKLDREKSDITAMKKALHALKTDKNVIIFPEGARIKAEKKVWKLAEGVGFIAQLAMKDCMKNKIPTELCPIVYPVAICYFWQKINIFRANIVYKICIDVAVGEPIEIDVKESRDDFVKKLSDILKKLYEETTINMKKDFNNLTP